MKKSLVLLMAPAALAFLSACGDSVENVNQINQMGMEVVSSEDDLPKCNKDNEGEQALVKGESVVRVCVDGKWAAMDGAGGDYSCSTVELKDKSGLKIICNGDSIGVVYNGADGKQGKAGKDGEDGKDGADGKDVVADTTVVDSERVAISLDSLVGVTQKGPFLKGSTVYLYELSDGRTLKQTNGNFTSNITRDDGRYKFLARDLVSQYAMVVVDGYYRNEVTGVSSNAPIRLKAITDMRKRSSVNVNLLTHLEFERVYHLVTRGDSTGKKLTVKQAKRQAQREILNEFHMVLGDTTDAEDMDVFGSSDADAALLAISVLLQGDRTESEMMALLSEISTDMAEDGKWNDDQAKALKTQIADWAFTHDPSRFRKNVEGWHLAAKDSVGNFEKYTEAFVAGTYGVKPCCEGGVQTVKNDLSEFNGTTLGWHDGMLLDKRENPYLNDTVKYEQFIDWRTRRVYNALREWQEMYVPSMDSWAYLVWMTENLDYDYKVKGESYGSFVNSKRDPAWGRYYRWDVAQRVCPDGWHLPSKEEWNKLYMYSVGHGRWYDAAGLYAKEGWEADVTNASGFSLIATGHLYYSNGESKLGMELQGAVLWTSTVADSTSRFYSCRFGAEEPVFSDDFTGDYIYGGYALPVRCVKQDTVIVP